MPLVPSLIVNVPTGGGGGCIHDGRIHNGALVNMSVNLGPVSSNGFLPGYIGGGTGLDYNPRCLVRDIGPAISRSGLAYQNVIDLLARSADCTAFVNNLDTGVHAAGHNSIGGMLFDLFVLCSTITMHRLNEYGRFGRTCILSRGRTSCKDPLLGLMVGFLGTGMPLS